MSNSEYWKLRYQESNTPWDMGTVSPPLSGFLQKIYQRSKRILIPGAGNAYEAEWLWKNGFKNTYVVDLANEPLNNLKNRVPDFPSEQLICGDFFELDVQFDLVVEQTFFCALSPDMRSSYVKKMNEILFPGGQLVGLLFNFPLTEKGPPFGGSLKEYTDLFKPYFSISKIETCYNSIKPRLDSELFLHLIKN